MIKGVYFNLADTFHDIYEKEYEQEVLIKKEIDPHIKQREEKYPCLYIEKEVWDS